MASGGGSGVIMRNESAAPKGDYLSLYRSAFRDYGCRALWNVRELENPGPEDVLAIARYLRVEGDIGARRLAERIERACRGVV